MDNHHLSSSFRDPSGFLFFRNGLLLRQINKSYKADYDHLIGSGLHKALVEAGELISHEEVDISPQTDAAYKILKPKVVDFISYPYEWSFSALKDAARLTLNIQKKAIDFGMCLKDASAFNIQFVNGRPILIDTLSFEKRDETKPWVAYRQFCQHFLAPLALIAYKDVRLSRMFQVFIDGVPLDLASSLLPGHTRLKPSLLMHIHLHAKSQQHFSDKTPQFDKRTVSKNMLLGLINSLESAVANLTWQPGKTEWGDYHTETSYTTTAAAEKYEFIRGCLNEIRPKTVWDLGANIGHFSRLAGQSAHSVLALDADELAVERNYLQNKTEKIANVLPLIMDLTNPSPCLGWGHEERMSLCERGPADMILALALIHHLAISNNLPLSMIADFFSKIGTHLIIEFVPKTDMQVKRLLATRTDIFPSYTPEAFEMDFSRFFLIKDKVRISKSDRIMYLMKVS